MAENQTQIDLAALKESEEAYKAFLVEARALDKSSIIPFRADELLALHNVTTAQRNILAHQEELEKKGFSRDDLQALAQSSAVALAVVFAVGETDRLAARSPEGSRKQRARASVLRRSHLLIAEGCALLGLLPLEEVEKIQAGTGPIDTARDCIELAALYRRHQTVLAGKTPSTPELQKEMSELGTELLTVLTPSGAKSNTATSDDLQQAQDIRDRLWTLLEGRYDLLTSAATKLVGRKKAKTLVPALQSRVVEPKKTATPE